MTEISTKAVYAQVMQEYVLIFDPNPDKPASRNFVEKSTSNVFPMQTRELELSETLCRHRRVE